MKRDGASRDGFCFDRPDPSHGGVAATAALRCCGALFKTEWMQPEVMREDKVEPTCDFQGLSFNQSLFKTCLQKLPVSRLLYFNRNWVL